MTFVVNKKVFMFDIYYTVAPECFGSLQTFPIEFFRKQSMYTPAPITVVLKIIQPPLLFPMTSIETSCATLIVVLTVCFRSIKI